MRVHLQYGRSGLDVDLPGDVALLEPRFVAGLPDERAACLEALRHPIAGPPLASRVRAGDRVAIVIPDITRPLPTARLLPGSSRSSHVPAEHFVDHQRHRLAPGKHARRTSRDGRRRGRSRAIASSTTIRTILPTLALAGTGEDGHPVLMNRDYVEADRRIVLGFIEPHFMAGFSGGCKGIFPAVADIASIMRYHDARMIGDPSIDLGRS